MMKLYLADFFSQIEKSSALLPCFKRKAKQLSATVLC